MKFLAFLCIFSISVLADKTIERTSVVQKNEIFKINSLDKPYSLSLGKNIENAYFLHQENKGKVDSIKFSSHLGDNLDKEFTGLFIKFLYEMPATKKKCKKIFNMQMRTEKQSICANEKEKIQSINKFISKLETQF